NGLPQIDPDRASVVRVSTGDVSGLVIVLPEGGSISGTITATNGVPLEGIDIDVFDAAGNLMEADADTDSNGVYVVGGFPAGNYFVRCDPSPEQGYIYQYYSNTLEETSAVPVAVLPGQITSNIHFVLSSGGVISGTTRDAAGDPARWIDIDVFDVNGRRMLPNATSDYDGRYTIGPFPPGDYITRADPTAEQGLLQMYYNGVVFSEDATPVSVGLTAVTNIDFSLLPGRSIEGTMTDTNGTPLAGIDLDLFDTNGVRLDVNATSGDDGRYSIGALLPGAYILRADPAATQGYIRAYYGDHLFEEDATPIMVRAETDTTNIDFQLRGGSLIAGTVYSTNLIPLAGIDLDVFSAAGVFQEATARTDVNGNYVIGPFPAGAYTLRA
ncbi:MAG: carboxypeptidase regulatory-like domain-containing protein, partial [Verrucomicrobiota bacterium]